MFVEGGQVYRAFPFSKDFLVRVIIKPKKDMPESLRFFKKLHNHRSGCKKLECLLIKIFLGPD